jgi:lysophospholipase L1-like esterase
MLHITVGLILTACTYKPIYSLQSNINRLDGAESMASNRYRYLALGDSYTIGESVQYSERWPVQLVNLLRKEQIEVDDPLIIARTGWTTDDLMDGIEKEKPDGTYDVVSLLIGVNNQYQGRSTEEYREEFRTLLERSIAFAGGRPSHVIVLSIPDWGVTPSAEGRDREQIGIEIDEFNAINLEEATRRDVHYVDVTPISREMPDNPTMLAADELHPSGKMYEAWARLVLPKVLPMLRSK